MRLAAVIFCLLNFIPISSQAVVLKDLYQGDVVVSSRQLAESEQAMPKILAQVLVKVSGNQAIASLPVIQKKLRQADSLVEQFSYQNQTAEGGTQQLMLHVRFTPSAVVQLLHQAGQGVWGASRPLILTWVATEQGLLLGSDSATDLSALLSRDANKRGLVMTLPMLDLSDRANLSYDNVWKLNWPALQTASKRYAAGAILVVKLQQQADNSYQASWTLSLQGEEMTWQVKGDNLEQLVQAGVDNVADALASRFAVLSNKTQAANIMLTVSNVASVAQYAKIMSYLKHLAPVNDVDVVKVDAEAVSYKIALAGSTDALVQALTVDPILVPVNNSMLAADQTLHYRLGS